MIDARYFNFYAALTSSCLTVSYEEKIAIAEANIGKAVADCNKVRLIYDKLGAEKNELVLALQSGGSAVQDIIDKTCRIENMKNDLQKQLDDTTARIRAEEDAITTLDSQSNKVKQDADKLRGEVQTLESTLESTEEDNQPRKYQAQIDDNIDFVVGNFFC